MPKTVRFDLTAAPTATSKTKGNRLVPLTPEKHPRVLQSRHSTSVPRQHPTQRTSKDNSKKSRMPQAAGHREKAPADDQLVVKQSRDAKGRFSKTTRKPSKTQAALDKLKKQSEKIKLQVQKLEVALEKENQNRTRQQSKHEAKAARKLAKDFHWICSRVIELQNKIQSGSTSQRKYAAKQLPKFIRRRVEAQAAFDQMGGSSSKTAFPLHPQHTCDENPHHATSASAISTNAKSPDAHSQLSSQQRSSSQRVPGTPTTLSHMQNFDMQQASDRKDEPTVCAKQAETHWICAVCEDANSNGRDTCGTCDSNKSDTLCAAIKLRSTKIAQKFGWDDFPDSDEHDY